MRLLCVAVAVFWCGTATAQPKTLSKRDRARLDRPAPLFPLEPAWTTPLPAPPVTGPAVDDARVYVPLSDGTLAAADRDSGAIVWTVPAEVSLPPATAGETVIVAGARQIAGYDAASGQTRWTGTLDAAPAWLTVAGDVAVVAVGRRVLAYNVAAGSGRWSLEVPAPIRIEAAAAGGRLVVADESGAVTLIDLARGAVLWTRSVSGRPGALAMTADRVFVGTSARELRALDVASGAMRWRWRTGGDVSGARADGDRVFVITLDNLVRALDASSGNQYWKASLGARPSGAPLLLKNLVLVSGVAARVDGFVRKTGAAAGLVMPPAELTGSPAVVPLLAPYRVALVVATRAGALHAFLPERMMFREPRSAPITVLPGRRLVPEPAPDSHPSPSRPARP